MSENDYKNEPWYSHLLLCAKFANDKEIRDACDGAVTELAEHEKLELALVGKLGRRDRTIARLQAVVERYPKTADGVFVVPGMELHVPGSPWTYTAKMMSNGGRPSCSNPPYLSLKAWGLYSTKEAADKAEMEGLSKPCRGRRRPTRSQLAAEAAREQK